MQLVQNTRDGIRMEQQQSEGEKGILAETFLLIHHQKPQPKTQHGQQQVVQEIMDDVKNTR